MLTLFYEHFIKTEILPRELHQHLHYAFELRQQGDYWSDPPIDIGMSEDLFTQAEAFLEALSAQLPR